MDRTRILLAEDHADFLAMVRRLVEPEFDVVSTFSSGQALVDKAPSLNADLLVLDITMPGLTGIEAATRLRAAGCQAKVVFLTVHEDQDYLQSALAAGAAGYVVKNRLASDLLPALRAVASGGRYISPSMPGYREEASAT
ncbi:MAG TPA: response regulator transcription factor [Pirellulaceae bacterium]|nr:response regulator transcription factor [Pirellulaceae bacterium]